MDGRWDVDCLDELVARVQGSGLHWTRIFSGGLFFQWLKSKLFNLQIGKRAYQVGKEHYDLGNDLYEGMLDKRMVYTCAYWKQAKNLDEAQEAKLDLICRKIGLKEGESVLDIGCGWGSFVQYAAEKYGARCVGLSVSEEQIRYAREQCQSLPIEFVVTDYQKYTPKKKFDHIVSIEMFEAVGHKNYRTYMRLVDQWLKSGGRFLLQTIGTTHRKPLADPWLDKYIFPNGVLPNRRMIQKAIRGIWVIHDWHNIGPDYDRTLMAWWENFRKTYPKLDKKKYTNRFYRMWQYYLLSCAGGFRAKYLTDWQILMTKNGEHNSPQRIR
jgi:cyclopropane-fatty-acyl-phospholipid synthase